jgi:hypothetical protein
MKNLPIQTIRKVIWHGHFYYIISYFIILQKNIDILLAGLVQQAKLKKAISKLKKSLFNGEKSSYRGKQYFPDSTPIIRY